MYACKRTVDIVREWRTRTFAGNVDLPNIHTRTYLSCDSEASRDFLSDGRGAGGVEEMIS